MCSPTKATKRIRKHKLLARGQARKKQYRNHGTTPELFALNKPTAQELAQKQKAGK